MCLTYAPPASQTLNALNGTRARTTRVLRWVLQRISFRYVSRAATYIGKGFTMLNLQLVQGNCANFSFIGPLLNINLSVLNHHR